MTQDIKFDETVTKRIQDRWKDGDRLHSTHVRSEERRA